MRKEVVLSITCLVGLAAMPASAGASFIHTVTPGESLYSIAAADGLSVSQLAAANGLSAGTPLITGANIAIPPTTGGSSSSTPSYSSSSGSSTAGDGDADSDDVGATPSASGLSGYVVQPGDTLWSIAQRTGTTVAALAAANGLSSGGVLRAGAVLGGSGTSGSTSTATQSGGVSASGYGGGAPYPTNERLSASQIGQIGANNGATWPLTDAIAWQESGFNNDVVSPAGARGIMQILPGTWSWIQNNLAGGTLAPASASDNVRGGALMLHWLLNQTGGSPSMAAAGYYQGLSSVRRNGLFPDTQNYVNSVMSLNRSYGGG